jgi:hypothetical protein
MKNKPKWILLAIILVLFVFRLCLPYLIINYVENQINKIPEYRVKIEDLDVHLIRGSYTIRNLQLWKITKKIPVPFFSAETIDLSIEWSALLHGSLVGKILIDKPIINFVVDQSGKNEQLSLDDQWVAIVKTLFPLNFNSIQATQGKVYFRSYTGKPPFTIFLQQVEMQIQNMQNARHTNTLLPSTFIFSGKTMEQGTVYFSGRFNPFDKKPAFYFNGALKLLDVHQIKGFLKHFTSVDIQAGTFSLFGEAAAANNEITGYAKPFIKNLKIAAPKDSSPLDKLWDGAASVVASILKNGDKQTIATKINLHGNINDPNTSIFSIIGYMIRHSFIQALLPQVDHNISMQDVVWQSQKDPATTKKP